MAPKVKVRLFACIFCPPVYCKVVTGSLTDGRTWAKGRSVRDRLLGGHVPARCRNLTAGISPNREPRSERRRTGKCRDGESRPQSDFGTGICAVFRGPRNAVEHGEGKPDISGGSTISVILFLLVLSICLIQRYLTREK